MWESSMDAHAFARTPYLVRAPLLVREILLAFISEVDNSQHPLVGVFGYDERTFDFVRQGTSSSLLKLATNYVKANAITFEVNERLLKTLLKTIGSEQAQACRETTEIDCIYGHRQVVRELVMFMADSLADTYSCANLDGIIKFDPEVRRMLSRANARKLEWLANQMVEHRCVKFGFNKDKMRERTYTHMRFERREGVKDILVSKKATYAMMSFLFSEENEDSVKARRFRLGVTPLKGRPKTAPPNDYADFICLWIANQQMSELERFLMSHRKFGYGFDVLWSLYQRAKDSGEFDQRILDVGAKCSQIRHA
jgi:hypothetical protein